MCETKELIGNAFIALAAHKQPDKITVIDICRQASISRETFYYHFEDKFELFKWIYKSSLQRRLSSHFNEASWQKIAEASICDAMDISAFFEKVLSRSSAGFSQIMFDMLYELYYDALSQGCPDQRLPPQTEADLYIFLKGGIEYMKYYFQKDDATSYHTVAKRIAGAMPASLSALWENRPAKGP